VAAPLRRALSNREVKTQSFLHLWIVAASGGTPALPPSVLP
jgi:hypothetical protein